MDRLPGLSQCSLFAMNRTLPGSLVAGPLIGSILLFFPMKSGCQGFQTVTPIATASIVKNTGEKPQSKVWYYDDLWWAVFAKPEGTFIARLDGTEWSDNLKISSSTSLEADCKVVGNVCHIFLWRKPDNPSQLVSVQYDRASKSYSLWNLRRQSAVIPLDSGTETGTIDVDATGRMWLAYDGVDDIRVRWSDPPYDSWNGPHVIASGVTDDDICAIISLPALARIGVFWSDQNSKRFGFKTHVSGDLPSLWSADEVPASASALDVGKGMADDHLNLAAATDGTLYCAVKTGYDTEGFPRLALLKRRPDGIWDDLHEVSPSGTRAIVILNEVTEKLRVIYTSWEDGGTIVYRESPTSQISFGDEFTLIPGVYNNPTSTKDNYERNILILASDEITLVGVLAGDHPSVTVGVAQPLAREPGVSQCYPNPAKDILKVQFSGLMETEVFISIVDRFGRIYMQTISGDKSDQIEINLENLRLNCGLHFLILRSGGRSEIVRFIKH